jgi:hypothetical protein
MSSRGCVNSVNCYCICDVFYDLKTSKKHYGLHWKSVLRFFGVKLGDQDKSVLHTK